MKELRIGLRSAPFLADHGFQDMAVLPGSFYIQAALSMQASAPQIIRNVSFQNPIILSPDDTVIKVEVRDLSNGSVEYAFYEGDSEQCAARLQIERNAPTSADANRFSIDAFQPKVQSIIDSED